jgi:hypothetical protein
MCRIGMPLKKDSIKQEQNRLNNNGYLRQRRRRIVIKYSANKMEQAAFVKDRVAEPDQDFALMI